MLNPSTADHKEDDPTIRRCIDFSQRWGYHGMFVVNLYAFRATDPEDLYRSNYLIGPDNDEHISDVCVDRTVVCAWGAGATDGGRVRQVYNMIKESAEVICCLGTTSQGHPRHPLYVPADRRPVSYKLPMNILHPPPLHPALSRQARAVMGRK